MLRLNLASVLCYVAARTCFCQLVINVRNEVGDVLRESLVANTSDDTITLQYQKPEGTHITQFIDFKMVSGSAFTCISSAFFPLTLPCSNGGHLAVSP